MLGRMRHGGRGIPTCSDLGLRGLEDITIPPIINAIISFIVLVFPFLSPNGAYYISFLRRG